MNMNTSEMFGDNKLGKLAEEHYKHDLRESDRDALHKAGRTFSTYSVIGHALGAGLGLFFAYRLRANRSAMFRAFKTHEQPTTIKFASGREEPLPNPSTMMKPSTIGGAFTYSLMGLGGLIFGGQLGSLSGAFSARSQLNQDPESRERIQTAMRRFEADALRLKADQLDSGRTSPSFGV